MKKVLITLMSLMLLSSLFAISNEQVNTFGNSVNYSFELTRTEEVPDVFSRTFALPATEAELFINSALLVTYDESGNIVESTRNIGDDLVTISNSLQMREMYGFTVDIRVNNKLRNGHQVLEALDFDIRASNSVELPTEISEAFVNSYKKLAVNFDDSYLANLSFSRPKMLIVYPSTELENFLNMFARWKRASGFEVGTLYKDPSWTSASVLKQHIASYYEDHKPDYIMLFGDASGIVSIPTNMFISPDGTENDADDNYYTMLEGDETDYFPEALIGRFSIGDGLSLAVQSSKTINYEKGPDLDAGADNDWMNRALVVAGNYAENNLQPSTPVRMSRWVREQFLESGYTQVDTVFYPPTYPGTSTISSAISNGTQYISYRGWGDANGWHYPHFHMGDLDDVTNVNKLPIVYSIVCNTGDFANPVNPNFGELWMRLGTITNHKGAVAFVGPSDLHTKTKFNNAISTGMFSSFLQDDTRIFGSTVLDGKIELYNNYPLDRDHGGYVQFYFHVYNMLSDPSLKMWVKIPQAMEVTGMPSSLDNGTSYIELEFPQELNNAIVTSTKNNDDYEYVRVKNGRAIVPINTAIEGDEVTITITKANFKPVIADIPISSNNNIAIEYKVIEPYLQPGQTSSLTIHLMNHGPDYENVVADLSTANPHITISENSYNVGNLNSGATASASYTIEVSNEAEFAEIADFELALTPSGNTEKFSIFVTGGYPYYILHNGEIVPGQANEVQVTFRNTGAVDLASGEVRIRALHSGIINDDITVDYSSAAVNNTTTVTFSPQLDALATPGVQALFRFEFTEALSGYKVIQFVNIPISGVTPSHPTGPDSYGYYAYGNNDTAYSSAPVYNWIDIDPSEGGSGTVQIVDDDDSFVTDLPFTFRYYGEDFDEITICSNGWMSFGSTWYVNFTNSAIPSALGPKYQICPNWDDLKGLQTEQNVYADMRVSTYHDQDNNRFIIEWNDTYTQSTIDQFENADLQKFQVILEPIPDEDGDIIFQYHTFSNPSAGSNYTTIGIMNGERNDGIQYTFANMYPESAEEVASGSAIRFTKTPPDSFVSNDNNVQVAQSYLLQNYPNPFNPETNISFALKAKSHNTDLSVYNIKGQLVKTLIKGSVDAGIHNIVWDGTNNNDQAVTSGVYYYKLTTENKTITKKMILMK